ncbi:hypothetical protein [Actinomadura rugatobispora]|uniref:Uncharacterized protein n=1 Tax=Actinomadura rugatobispora TaxID=1994 RepID=A0ABW0ZNT8_9ACTN|nr:hypothetical protein GCM10010200_037060 [Actinomadura rugatobispora]
MKRNTLLASAAALAAGTAIALAPPAHAASWGDVPTSATAYDGTLDRVDFAGKDVGWAVGSSGSLFTPKTRLLRWTTSGWATQTSPADFIPTDIAVGNANRAWVVGYSLTGMTGLYWNGTTWTKVPYPLVGLPTQVSAAPDGTAYSVAGVDAAAGGLSAIMRWNGTAWVDTSVPLPPSSAITAVDVRSANDVWLAGTTSNGTAVTGLVMHYDGTSWKRHDLPGNMGVPAYQGTLHRIVALSPTNVYALRVRQNAQVTNALLHWNGTSWRTIDTPLNAAGIGLSPDGSGGVVMLPITTGTRTQYMHYDGSTWTTLNGPSRTGTVQATDADHRPGTTAVVSTGTATAPDKKTPFIENFS